MKLLLAAVLATVIAAPCMAANENEGDKTSADVLTPGVNEPRVPDTLKPGADERIRTEGRASESSAAEKKSPMSGPSAPKGAIGDRDDGKK
jgi:hypothetical protein